MATGSGKERVAGFRDHENEFWDPIQSKVIPLQVHCGSEGG